MFHLFSHGKPGQLFINGQWLKAPEIAAWLRSSLPEGTEHLNLYGCEFAQGEEGQQAVQTLQQLLGLSVAASDDVTGQGGDWDLEVGQPLAALRVEDYAHSLQDADGDGVLDAADLDDDNDGILSCVEDGLSGPVSSYFNLRGNAIQIASNELRLTDAVNSQSGQAWSFGKIDFTKSFQFLVDVNLGTRDVPGADGIAITFHNDPAGSNASGIDGAGLGSANIKNGVVLEIDTYQNTGGNNLTGLETVIFNDPPEDHTTIIDSDTYTNLTTAVTFPNLEDGAWRTVQVTWNAVTKNLSFTLNGVAAGNITEDLINTRFGGASRVVFGFTASTGGAFNEQRIRFANACSLPLTLDTDGDGITNSEDLDSDNDGCFDAIEGGANFTTTTGTLPGPYTNGVPTVAGAGQTVDRSQVATQIVSTGPTNFTVTTIPSGTLSFTVNSVATDTTVFSGGTPTYSAGTNVSGTNVYQWYLGDPNAAAPNTGTPISNGGVYSGATSPTLTISNAQGLIGNTYYVVVTNPTRNECARVKTNAQLLSSVVDLAITKTNNLPGTADLASDTLTRGATTSYQIVVTNNGPGPVSGATVTDTATGLTCTTLTCSPPASPGPSACPASLPTAAAFTSGSSITLGTLPVDGKVTLDVGCTVN